MEYCMLQVLLNEKDVSAITSIPIKTLRYWRFAGTTFAPKFIKLGSRVYYAKEDLEHWLKNSPRYSSSTEAQYNR